MPPKTVAQLLAERAKQQAARARSAAKAAKAAEAAKAGEAPDATKAMKRKAETTGYETRLYASFVDAAQTAFQNGDRGCGMPSGSGEWFVDAAHRWGELFERVDAKEREKVRLGVGSAARALPTPLPLHGAERITHAQSREAYCKGYELWFLSAREMDAAQNADPSAEPSAATRAALRPLTATADNYNGAGAKAHADAPLASLHERALTAFAQSLAAREERNRQAAIHRAAEVLHADGSSEMATFVPVRCVPNAPSLPATPPTTTPSPVVAGGSVKPTKPRNVRMRRVADVLEGKEGFLAKPAETYKFGTSDLPGITDWVNNAVLRQQCVARVVADGSGKKQPVIFKNERGETRNSQHLYETMRDQWAINDLAFDQGGRVSNQDVFKSLGLTLVGVGTYNTVWRYGASDHDQAAATAAAASAAELRATLPAEAAEALISGEYVLRMPKPSQWSTHKEVCQEMINATEAAIGGYGLRIAAMWVGSRNETTSTGMSDSAHKLFMIVERGTDVDRRIKQLRAGGAGTTTATTGEQWKAYLAHLRMCIWRVSANRCVAIDSKLTNFVDAFGEADSIVDASAVTSPAVRVIDVDGRYYRRLERLRKEEVIGATTEGADGVDALTAAGWRRLERLRKEEVIGATTEGADGVDALTAAGWRACWVYNVLVISCELRRVLDETTYFAHWWKPIEAAVRQVLADAKGATRGALDAEYQRGCEFLQSVRWTHPFRFETLPPRPAPEDTPAALAQIAVDNAKHYFHDAWFVWARDVLVEPAKAAQSAAIRWKQAQQQRGPDVSTLEQAYYAARANCRSQWETHYDKLFRPKVLPMIRFFEHAAQPVPFGAPPPTSGCTLTETMAGYAAATGEDLHPYTNGLAPYVNAATRDGGAKRPRVASPVAGPAIARYSERAKVANRWPRAPERYGDWVLEPQIRWSAPQMAKRFLGFGVEAINRSDAY